MTVGRQKEKATPRAVANTFFDAFLARNIVLVQAIGLCPIIAAGTTLKYGVVLTVCTALVLLPSALMMSLLGEKMPAWLRAPAYTIGAAALLAGAAFVIDRFIDPRLFGALEIFIPLIAVNTLVSYRAGGFAVTHGPALALTDAVASTLGFGLVICAISALRELTAFGTLWGRAILSRPLLTEAALPFAAFLMLGFMAAALQWVRSGILAAIRRREESGGVYVVAIEEIGDVRGAGDSDAGGMTAGGE